MSLTGKLFRIGLKQISNDGMLLVLLPAPFLVGLIFKLAVPFLNGLAEETLSFALVPWYGLADGLLACLTPLFTAMVCAFLLLEERDEGLGSFYKITPAAGYPYLMARIGIPLVWTFAVTVIALSLFNLSQPRLNDIVFSAIISVFSGLALAMMVVSLAGNRVEGLAISKMMGVSLLGLLIVWFVPAPYHFLGAFLPSFWIGEILLNGVSFFSFSFGTLISFLWIALFTGKFLRSLT